MSNTIYTYYGDNADGVIRRYPEGSETGERWDKTSKRWERNCAPREACILTKDAIIPYESLPAIMTATHPTNQPPKQ